MYAKLEKKLGIKFKNKNILDTAFVHRSYVNEHKDEKKEHNERLEFLGDSVLEMVVTEFLYDEFPKKREGELTNLRAALVKGKHLAEVARELDIGRYFYLSYGEEKSGGRDKALLLANTLEALIGAIYLDRGFNAAHKFIDKFILKKLGKILSKGLHVDAKSHLQELAQKKFKFTPLYKVISEKGPDHKKTFTIGVYIGEKLIGTGGGTSKQKAEEEAAINALSKSLGSPN